MVTRLRRAIVGIAVILILSACAASPRAEAPTSTVAPGPTGAGPTTTIATTTTALPTTTAPTTTTTTTTIPPLDRGDQATADRMRSDLDALLSEGPRVSGSPAEVAATRYFAEQAKAITGVAPTLQPVPLPAGGESTNVWVTEIGTGQRVLLLGAHLDSVAGAPGADDNGSGVVILLELLRRLVERPPTSLRVVVVGFGAEEEIGDFGDHFGSGLAVESLQAAGMLPDRMLSVDMVGVGDEIYAVDLRDHDPSFADEVVAAAAAAGVEVGRLSRGSISDHAPFARAGVPSAHLSRPDDSAWHTPNDDTVSDEAMLETLEVVEAVVDHLSSGS